MLKISKKHYIIKNIDLFQLDIQNILKKLAGVDDISIISLYFEDKSITFEFNYFYCQIVNGMIYCYWKGSLIYCNNLSFTSIEITKFTEASISQKDHLPFINGLNDEIMSGLYLIYNVEMNNLKEKKSSRTFGMYHKIKELSAELYEYVCATEPYIINEKNDKITVLLNTMYRKSYSIPTREYPLPGCGKYRYFYKGNCSTINDNGLLDSLLKGFQGEFGKCFKNTECLIMLLKSFGYEKEHVIEYFSGWLFTLMTEPIFHAWVVIDNCSVIDVGVFNESTNNEYFLEDKIECGDCVANRDLFAKNMKSIKDDTNSLYSRYYNYGDCGNFLYVGTSTTREEAAAMFKKVLENSKIKSYDNVDKVTGENKLQKIYKKI